MSSESKSQVSFLNLVSVYRDRRLWKIFLLGTISGFPWFLIGSGMTAWMTDAGLSRTAVGLFSVVFIAYTINFLWAPLIDHLPVVGAKRFGQRKAWITCCLIVLIGLGSALSLTGPTFNLYLTAMICLAIAVVSATQDLAIDAYRITIIEEHEEHLIGHGAAMATCGWWTGLSLPGAVAFMLADQLGWNMVFVGTVLVFVLMLWGVLVTLHEPPAPASTDSKTPKVTGSRLIDKSYVGAVTEFFQRNGMRVALGLLLFIFAFKLGEAFLGRMVIVFYKEVGFTNADIGVYSKTLGLFITVTCAIAAGFFTSWFGNIKGLLLAGIGMAATNLLFAWLAVIGPDKTFLVFALVADGITSALSTVAFVAFLTHFTSHLHAAAQYGALASLGNSGRTLLAATSGIVVDWLGGDWSLFFIITAVMVLPALVVLWWIGRSVRVDTASA